MYVSTWFNMVHFCCIRRPFFLSDRFLWSLNWSLRSLTVYRQQMVELVLSREGNVVRMGQNVGYQNLLFFRKLLQENIVRVVNRSTQYCFVYIVKVSHPENRIPKSCFVGYFRCTKGIHSHFRFRLVRLSSWNMK